LSKKNELPRSRADGVSAEAESSSRGFIPGASSRVFARKNNIKFLQIDLEKKFSLDKKFDTIVLAAVVEHLENPLSVLKKLSIYLQRNGIIIITTPTNLGIKVHKWLSFFLLTSQEAAHQHKAGVSKENFLEFEKILKCRLIKYQRFLLGFNQLIIFEKSD
jgi:2-polyprenyl-3-methyl-5-hydroxy-6-metoxy-1,4-benzoquinol methylase